MRASRSWPRSAVPSGWASEGPWSFALKSISLIGAGQANGPVATAATIARSTTVPTIASRWRRNRRHASPQSVALAAGGGPGRRAAGAARGGAGGARCSAGGGAARAGGGGADEPGERGALEQAEHGDRHERLLDAVPRPLEARGVEVGAVDEGQPVELDAEDQDEDEPREERGQGEADEGERRGDLVEERVGAERGEDADRQRDQDAEELRRAEDPERRAEAVQEEGVDVDPADEREAPVAPQHRDEPARVADEHRVVQAELLAQPLGDLGGHVRVGRQLLEGVARREGQHAEEDEADPGQDGDRDQEAAQEVPGHGARGPGRRGPGPAGPP